MVNISENTRERVAILLKAVSPDHTENFHKWFGGSKVVDEQGDPKEAHTNSAAFAAPKVVYHGTSSDFKAFDAKRNAKNSLYGPGHYFTENKEIAGSYLDHVKGTSASAESAKRKATALGQKAMDARLGHGRKYTHGIPPPDQTYHVHSLSESEGIQTHYHGTDLTKAHRVLKSAYKNHQMSTNLSSYSPHEKEDYHRSLAEMQDSHHAGVAAKNAFFKKQAAVTPKVHSLYLNIKKPFDVHNPAHAKEVAKFHGVKLGTKVEHGGHYDGYYHLRKATGGSGGYDGQDNTHVHELIKKAGFDGITHIGGIHTNSPVKHRVWIAMHDNQIKHTGNRGTFDPKSRDMYKAVKSPEKPAAGKPAPTAPGKPALTAKAGKAKLPTDPKAFAALDTRLGQEMGKCAAQYDQARADLKAHHGKCQAQEAALLKQIDALRPSVEGLTEGTGPGLTKAVAKDCLKYMELLAQVQRVRQGARLAYGATVAPGEQRLGGAIGDPKPGDVPGDLQGDKESDNSEKRSTSSSVALKGVKVAVLLKAIEGGNYDKGNPSYMMGGGGKPTGMAAPPKPAYFADGMKPTIARAAAASGLHHLSSATPDIAHTEHSFVAQKPIQAAVALHSSLTGKGYTHAGVTATPAGITTSFKTPQGHTHAFHIAGDSAVGPAAAKTTAPPAPKSPLGAVKPAFKMPKIAVHFGGKFGGTKAPAPAKMPKMPAAPPVNHFDSAGAAGSVGGHLHDVKSRTVKPMFGKAREEHAHLMSHVNPRLAAHDLHAQMAGAGHKVGPMREQRVEHADGGMAHLYSFDHHDEHGVKHTIHMIRSVRQARSTRTRQDQAPRQEQAPKSAPKAARRRTATPKAAAAPKAAATPKASSSQATGPKGYDPGMAMTQEAFTHGFIQHHAEANTLPSSSKGTETALNRAWASHTKQYPHPSQ